MANESSPLEVKLFIARYFHTVEQVEILCLLAENSGKVWSEGEIFQRIQSSVQSVALNLRHLTEAGFLSFTPEVGHAFSPQTEEADRLTAELIKAYRERRVAVVQAIYNGNRK